MSNSGSDDNSGQSVVLTLKVAEAGSSIDEEILEDLGRNADLYIFKQDAFADGWRTVKCIQGGVLCICILIRYYQILLVKHCILQTI